MQYETQNNRLNLQNKRKNTQKLAKTKNICTFAPAKRPDGGIGRRAGLKHQWIHFHPGSIPGLGTANPS